MTSREAAAIVFSFLKKEPVIVATGYLCRVTQAVADRPENFYMIGSMGMASSIALGVAVSKPKKKVIALDGDGAVLMNLGSLPVAGRLKPENFVHIVIDNASYESTGGQVSYTDALKLEAVAKACGYRNAARVSTTAALKRSMPALLKRKGPSFLLVRVSRDASAAAPRIILSPEAITAGFSKSLA